MTIFKLNLQLTDSDRATLRDAKEKGEVKKIRVKIEATHSGIINKNSWFYTPKGMKDGAKSFIKPYAKPILKNHDTSTDPLGRVEKAKYVDYGIQHKWSQALSDATATPILVDAVKKFTKSSVFSAKSYKGLGHVELIASITDEEAIDKVLKGEYLTVSIAGNTDKAICSICGSDVKDAEQSKQCSHWPGQVYDGETCFFIGGTMEFDECSYVNKPADKYATSEVIRDSERLFEIEDCQFALIDFDRSENESDKRSGTLKYKLQQVLTDKSIVDNTLKQLGLGDHVLAPESINKLRKSSFLFSDETALPVHDKAHVIAAYKILEQIEDCEEEVEQAKQVLDGKFKRMFSANELTVEDALKLVLPAPQIKDSQEQQEVKVEIDYEQIATRVVDSLKQHTKVDDSYLYQRNQTLEREIEEIEADYNKLNDMYRKLVVDQILTIEDRFSDADYRERLNKRSIQSLSDKLDDLRDQAVSKEPEVADEAAPETVEDKKLEDKNLSLDDAAENKSDIEDKESEQSEDENAASQETERLSYAQFQDHYKKVMMEEGLSAASKWAQKIRDENRLPSEII